MDRQIKPVREIDCSLGKTLPTFNVAAGLRAENKVDQCAYLERTPGNIRSGPLCRMRRTGRYVCNCKHASLSNKVSARLAAGYRRDGNALMPQSRNLRDRNG